MLMEDSLVAAAGSASSRAGAIANIEALLRPASVAIIGVSSRAGSPGQVVLHNLLANGYNGAVHLVGRGGGEIAGLSVLSDVADLPEGVDLAILVLPADAVRSTIDQLVARKVRSAVCFASGFAEMGEAGRQAQHAIGEAASAGGLALVGPNTVGYFNYVDGFHVMLVELTPDPPLPVDAGPALAVVAQSGGIGAHLAGSLQSRAVPISYVMTTGNEAQMGLADFISYFANDSRTGGIIVYAEQIGDPQAFLAGARAARQAGKPVVLMHPGKSDLAKHAASSHTGALAGDHAVMRIAAESAGVLVVDTLEELIDVGQLLLRYPEPPAGGLGILTGSGAICGITLDYVGPLGMHVPPLSESQVEALRPQLPDYTPPRNPLDLGTLVGWKPELMGAGAAALLADSAIGSLLVSFPMADPGMSITWMKSFVDATRHSAKPSIYVIHNEDKPLAPGLVEIIEAEGVIVMRSPERAMRALARLAQYSRDRAAAMDAGAPSAAMALDALPELGRGTQPEWLGKQVLANLGIAVPRGALAETVDRAVEIAGEIGYPVVMKAQAASLAHKSEAGGVLLRIADAAAVRTAWATLHDNIARAEPGLSLDGVLVEAMGERGLELVVGARRDPQWGPIIMVGLGGIWVEALGDVRLIPPGLPAAAICHELRSLKAAKLLDGFRGSPPVDVAAVAAVVQKIGDLMVARSDIVEIDVNPLMVYAQGKGALALDALIVTEDALNVT